VRSTRVLGVVPASVVERAPETLALQRGRGRLPEDGHAPRVDGGSGLASLPSDLVYVGFSLGVLSAQSLAQTRPGASGAVLCYSALPLGEWGDNWPGTWPNGVRLQLHIVEGDEDFEFAQRLATTVPASELGAVTTTR
jgi:hypothetical protein